MQPLTGAHARDVKDVIVITKRDRVQGGAKIRRELVDRYLSEVGASGADHSPSAPTAPSAT